MGRRIVISDGALARELTTYAVARSGLVKHMPIASVAQGGFVRQYWPFADTTLPDQNILWTTDEITSTQIVIDPINAVSSITFLRVNGTAYWADDPNPSKSEPFLNPALDGTAGDDDKYLIKVDQVSGVPIEGLEVPIPPFTYGYMQLDGTDDYDRTSLTPSGNKVTAVVRFNIPSFVNATATSMTLFQYAKSFIRIRLDVFSSDSATAELRQKALFRVMNNAGTFICQLLSDITVTDGTDHIAFISFDADTGQATFVVDENDVDDLGYSSRVLTTGTLESGSGFVFGFGADQAGSNKVIGNLAYFGYKDAYLTNYTDFMDGNIQKVLDEITWTEWGGQPLFWNRIGKMNDNQGTAGNMSVTGSPVEVPDSGGSTGWVDLNTNAQLLWRIVRSSVGIDTAAADISIAPSLGGLSPDGTRTVTRRVNFHAEVQASGTEGTIAWTTVQRDLVEITEAIDADCDLTFNPTGSAIGDADTSGAFIENWHTDTPPVSDPSLFTVQVDLVSGTAPTGPTLGVPHTLDQVRAWKLLATTGENFSNELDVTVADATTSVTKRITMNSQRTAIPTDVVWTTAQWNLDDVADDPNFAGVVITVDDDGIGKATFLNKPGTTTEDWHNEAPTPSDPENFEARLHVVSGNSADITGALDTDINLFAATGWTIKQNQAEFRNYQVELSIRRIGGIWVTKLIKILLSVEGAGGFS
jgi:hypothetical protein